MALVDGFALPLTPLQYTYLRGLFYLADWRGGIKRGEVVRCRNNQNRTSEKSFLTSGGTAYIIMTARKVFFNRVEAGGRF